MQIVSKGDNLYEISNPVFRKKKKKKKKKKKNKKLIDYVVCWKFYPEC